MPIFFDNIGDRLIVILSTSTRGWNKEEKKESDICLETIQNDISAAGYHSQIIEVGTSTKLKKILYNLDPDKVVIFNWIEEIDHLKYGYHTAPLIFEKMGFIYTGNSYQSLINSNDKIKTKIILKTHRVSTPKYTTLYKDDDNLNSWHHYPCIIKPSREHCSYGITRRSVVDNQKELFSRAKTLFNRYGQPLLVEEFIDGSEFFISAWGYDKIEILPPVCQNYAYTPDYHQHIYDYVAKWKSKTKIFHRCSSRLPVEFTTNVPEDLYQQVTRAIQATQCLGYCRIDVRVRNNIAYIIDINPNPDITLQSDFIIASARLGYNYGQTILKLCDLAVKNYSDNQIIDTTPIYSPSPLPLVSPSFASITS